MGIIHITKENFEEEVNKSEKPVVVDFWAPWCGPCQQMGPLFEELSNEIEGVKFAKLNVDEAQDLAMSYKVQGIPSLIILKEGKEIDRIVGMATKDQIKEKIEKSIK